MPKSARLKMYDVCDYRALAIALVEKCSLNLPSLFDGQRNMPWNIKPEFGGAPPAENKIKWHGRDNYDFLLPEVDDPVLLTGIECIVRIVCIVCIILLSAVCTSL